MLHCAAQQPLDTVAEAAKTIHTRLDARLFHVSWCGAFGTRLSLGELTRSIPCASGVPEKVVRKSDTWLVAFLSPVRYRQLRWALDRSGGVRTVHDEPPARLTRCWLMD